MRLRDRLIGIAIGIAVGLAIVAIFVFVFGDETVDAPSIELERPADRPAER